MKHAHSENDRQMEEPSRKSQSRTLLERRRTAGYAAILGMCLGVGPIYVGVRDFLKNRYAIGDAGILSLPGYFAGAVGFRSWSVTYGSCGDGVACRGAGEGRCKALPCSNTAASGRAGEPRPRVRHAPREVGECRPDRDASRQIGQRS